MKQKVILIVFIFLGLLILVGLFVWPRQKSSLSTTSDIAPKIVNPSETFIEYQDPVGFKFNYPDNVSLSKAEIEDPNIYTDIQLFSKDINGSLTLRVADSKLKSTDEWIKQNQLTSSTASAQRKLGNLKIVEAKTTDRLFLASLDQGVLFTLESPLIEQEFWGKVLNTVLESFTFTQANASGSQGSSNSTSEEVTFAGEEVIE